MKELLELKLDYINALQDENKPQKPIFNLEDNISQEDIIIALADLENRLRAGKVSTDAAQAESTILTTMLQAFNGGK